MAGMCVRLFEEAEAGERPRSGSGSSRQDGDRVHLKGQAIVFSSFFPFVPHECNAFWVMILSSLDSALPLIARACVCVRERVRVVFVFSKAN